MEPITSWQFMWRTIDKAVGNTAQFFGLDLKTILTTVGLIALGFFLHWKIRGSTETREEVSKYVILVAAPFVLFLAALLLYNLFRAPYLVYAQEFGKIATNLLNSEGAREGAESKVQGAEARARSAESRVKELEAVKPQPKVSSADSKAITHLQTQLDDKQKRKTIRDQIAIFINQGTGIQQQCLAQVATDEQVRAMAQQWAQKTLVYLDGIEASYSARFNSSMGPTYTGGQPSETKREVWNYINLRVQTLSQLLQELKD